mgnify:FL=1
MKETQLYLNGVTKSFDGFKAIDGLSMVVARGELHAVIGPNGAGKTTMMDIVTGKTRPDEGEVYWNGDVDLTRTDEVEAARLGIGRKFQKPTVIESLSVADNLYLALKAPRGVWATFFARMSGRERDEIERLLALVRLVEARDRPAGDLSHGQKQWLEIGMLLA